MLAFLHLGKLLLAVVCNIYVLHYVCHWDVQSSQTNVPNIAELRVSSNAPQSSAISYLQKCYHYSGIPFNSVSEQERTDVSRVIPGATRDHGQLGFGLLICVSPATVDTRLRGPHGLSVRSKQARHSSLCRVQEFWRSCSLGRPFYTV